MNLPTKNARKMYMATASKGKYQYVCDCSLYEDWDGYRDDPGDIKYTLILDDNPTGNKNQIGDRILETSVEIFDDSVFNKIAFHYYGNSDIKKSFIVKYVCFVDVNGNCLPVDVKDIFGRAYRNTKRDTYTALDVGNGVNLFTTGEASLGTKNSLNYGCEIELTFKNKLRYRDIKKIIWHYYTDDYAGIKKLSIGSNFNLYKDGDVVVHNGNLWSAYGDINDADDEPSKSIHWEFLCSCERDEFYCPEYTPTPTPTPTPSPTPTPTPTPTPEEVICWCDEHPQWIPRNYDWKSVVSYEGYIYQAHDYQGTEAADVPGVSNHWFQLCRCLEQCYPTEVCVRMEESAGWNLGITHTPDAFPTPTPTPTPMVCLPVSHTLGGDKLFKHNGNHENAYDGDVQTATGEYLAYWSAPWNASTTQSKVWVIYTFDSPVEGERLHIDIDVSVTDGYGNLANFLVDYKQSQNSGWTEVWKKNSHQVPSRKRLTWEVDLSGKKVYQVRVWTHDIGKGSPRFRVFDVSVRNCVIESCDPKKLDCQKLSLHLQSNNKDGEVEFKDTSIKELSLQRIGNAHHSTEKTLFGRSTIHFPVGTRIDLEPTEELRIGTGEFTIDAWVYVTNTRTGTNPPSHSDRAIVGTFSGNGGRGAGHGCFLFLQNKTNQLCFWDGVQQRTGNLVVEQNKWTHVAVSRRSGVLRLFVNGQHAFSANHSVNMMGHAGWSVGGGRTINPSAYNRWFDGHIQDVRVIKGLGLYSCEFDRPTGLSQICRALPNPVIKLLGETLVESKDVWENSAETNYFVTLNGNHQKIFTDCGGVKLANTGGFIEATNYGKNPNILSFEITFKILSDNNITGGSSSPDRQYVVFQQNERASFFEGYSLQYYESSKSLVLVATNPNTREQFSIRTPEDLVGIGKLVHVVCVFEIDKMHLYVDGRLEATGKKWSGGISYHPSHKLTIGRANAKGSSHDGYMNGTVYEFSLFENKLSNSEVNYLYNNSKSRLGGC